MVYDNARKPVADVLEGRAESPRSTISQMNPLMYSNLTRSNRIYPNHSLAGNSSPMESPEAASSRRDRVTDGSNYGLVLE